MHALLQGGVGVGWGAKQVGEHRKLYCNLAVPLSSSITLSLSPLLIRAFCGFFVRFMVLHVLTCWIMLRAGVLMAAREHVSIEMHAYNALRF